MHAGMPACILACFTMLVADMCIAMVIAVAYMLIALDSLTQQLVVHAHILATNNLRLS
jgi:hypothetical protein